MHRDYLKNTILSRHLREPVTLLFIQYDENISTKRVTHAHAYWQFEYIVSGLARLRSGKNKLEVRPDDIVLIPPGNPHRFIFGDKAQVSWSVKFNTNTALQLKNIVILKRSEHSMDIRHLLLAELNKYSFTRESFLVIESLLSLLMELELHNCREVSVEPTTADRIKMFINNQEGKRLTVNEVADFAGYSRNYVSSLFHRETGIKLKTYIDRYRAETAAKMLQYSNLKIIEIAEIMDFPDVFSFSKFFFQNTGIYPGEFRQQKQFTIK